LWVGGLEKLPELLSFEGPSTALEINAGRWAKESIKMKNF
jgi:hypothetical protein